MSPYCRFKSRFIPVRRLIKGKEVHRPHDTPLDAPNSTVALFQVICHALETLEEQSVEVGLGIGLENRPYRFLKNLDKDYRAMVPEHFRQRLFHSQLPGDDLLSVLHDNYRRKNLELPSNCGIVRFHEGCEINSMSLSHPEERRRLFRSLCNAPVLLGTLGVNPNFKGLTVFKLKGGTPMFWWKL